MSDEIRHSCRLCREAGQQRDAPASDRSSPSRDAGRRIDAIYAHEQAKRYRKRADEVADVALRYALLGLADSCDSLARDLERREAGLASD
jgi:hypothetical protein